MDTPCIDPMALLGVTIESTPTEVKKAYYNLSLLCHPDKGGNTKDMACLHAAYRFVMTQQGAVNRTDSVESLESRFAEFCKCQTDLAPPSFCDIADDVDELDKQRRRKEFEDAFTDIETLFAASDKSGYGNFMMPSEYAGMEGPVQYSPLCAYASDDEDPEFQPFTKDIIQYVEPSGNPMVTSLGYGDAMPVLAGDTMTMAGNTADFGTIDAGRYDYRTAFDTTASAPPPFEESTLTFDDLVARRDVDFETWSKSNLPSVDCTASK